MSNTSAPLRVTAAVIKVVVLLLTLAYIGEKAAELKTLQFVAGDAGHNVGTVFAFWMVLLPAGFYLCALWAAANVLARLGKGDAFGPAMRKGLRGMGINLLFSALARVILIPVVAPMLDPKMGGFELSASIEGVTIGLIGAVFLLLAQRGGTLKAELEAFV